MEIFIIKLTSLSLQRNRINLFRVKKTKVIEVLIIAKLNMLGEQSNKIIKILNEMVL